jgi:hypothetical protein
VGAWGGGIPPGYPWGVKEAAGGPVAGGRGTGWSTSGRNSPAGPEGWLRE